MFPTKEELHPCVLGRISEILSFYCFSLFLPCLWGTSGILREKFTWGVRHPKNMRKSCPIRMRFTLLVSSYKTYFCHVVPDIAKYMLAHIVVAFQDRKYIFCVI